MTSRDPRITQSRPDLNIERLHGDRGARVEGQLFDRLGVGNIDELMQTIPTFFDSGTEHRAFRLYSRTDLHVGRQEDGGKTLAQAVRQLTGFTDEPICVVFPDFYDKQLLVTLEDLSVLSRTHEARSADFSDVLVAARDLSWVVLINHDGFVAIAKPRVEIPPFQEPTEPA